MKVRRVHRHNYALNYNKYQHIFRFRSYTYIRNEVKFKVKCILINLYLNSIHLILNTEINGNGMAKTDVLPLTDMRLQVYMSNLPKTY